MDKYMKKSDVIAYIRKEAKEAQSAFDELGGESGIIAQAFNDLANDFSQGAVPYTTAEEAFAQIPAVSVPQWISVKDRLPENKTRNIVLRYDHVTKTHFVDILWFCGNGWFCNPLGSGAEDKSISCWMPLPKPPKGENNG